MSIRLTLLCGGAGPTVRAARFDDGPLDERGVREARAAADRIPAASVCVRAPSLRCQQTAEALGLTAVAEKAVRDLDVGTWRGRTLAEVAADEPEALACWTTDPEAAPHGGESVRQLCLRAGLWMDGLPQDAGRVLALTEPAVVRAAVVHALAAPVSAFWRIDVPPLATISLTRRSGRWNMRLSPSDTER
ncbi:histidine phosphatase family protein [Streptomyces sp. ISL-10]|uniref:histidine phosphatase family protein n=1 Tax=Streptomyces sp. ISL-10 TaxID=2819172 RepID=UPI001BE7C45D|nr:histidine phosphatase family protein [Streptomyces sp. ISL-10]MBT2370277.1 histidine phosphatase family protein [Streptomyces sp. ISL-10]